MKRQFGTPLLRFFRGGILLSEAEHALLTALVDVLPDQLRRVVESQLEEYNLVQREADGRALNFYKLGFLERKPRITQALLEGPIAEAPLVRAAVAVRNAESLHVSLVAVNRRVFGATFSRRVIGQQVPLPIRFTRVIPSWRSNFPENVQSHAASGTPRA